MRSLENVPEVLLENRWLWKGWELLNERRIYDEVGPRPIPMTEINAYVEYIKLCEEDERDDFLYVVTLLDRAFREHVFKKSSKARRQADARAKANARQQGRR